VLIVYFAGRFWAADLFHPAQTVGVLLDWKDFARILLNTTIAFPDTPTFARILQVRKVRCALVTERLLEDLELFPVARRDRYGDLDRAADLLDRPADAATEPSAGL